MSQTPKTVYLKDYKKPDYKVQSLYLTFKIFDDHAEVTSKAKYSGNGAPLILNGEDIQLQSITLNGQKPDYAVQGHLLTIQNPGKEFDLEIVTRIDPYNNTSLLGLFKSGEVLCTQCEAEGFRRITYFIDRPDVLTIFTTRIEADKTKFPILLSNGNPTEQGDLPNGRHFTVWNDPYPKPCYLFALVAGKLGFIQDSFTTFTGRIVDLRIYTEHGFENQCDHAMESLKKSMAWDEEVFGREYQLNRFNIVAVGDFNFGGMENTSLNIFNTALIYAHPETATDGDFYRVESVVAHEYFHNWTGNRITCRDWFQLSLKEGFTIFRDQEFSSDLNSRAVKRIDDVAFLRQKQFPEDAGPMAHPVRPDNYIEIDNMYDTTVYEKGGEIIRMFKTLLGADKFRKASDLYFDKFDGQAVTCDDFAACMEEAAGQAFDQFKLWYSQAGTPQIHAQGTYDSAKKIYTLSISQTLPPTPGQPDKKPMHIPLAVGLLAQNGQEIAPTRILHLTQKEQNFTFENVATSPIPSILREFSAPVKLTTTLTDQDWQTILAHDTDGFNRWEASQILSLRLIKEILAQGNAPTLDDYLNTIGILLDQAQDKSSDKALLARMLTLPDFSIIAQECAVVDPDKIIGVQQQLSNTILHKHRTALEKIYASSTDVTTYSPDPVSTGRRSMKAIALRFLSADLSQDSAARAADLYNSANNMTDRVMALDNLTHIESPQKEAVFEDFFKRFEKYPLVIDKWFSLQATARHKNMSSQIETLSQHPAFIWTNPNRVRALYGAFAMRNPLAFHDTSGKGYATIAQTAIKMDGINPFIASMLASSLKDWKRYTPERQALMRTALQQIADQKNISSNVFEIVSKSLAA